MVRSDGNIHRFQISILKVFSAIFRSDTKLKRLLVVKLKPLELNKQRQL